MIPRAGPPHFHFVTNTSIVLQEWQRGIDFFLEQGGPNKNFSRFFAVDSPEIDIAFLHLQPEQTHSFANEDPSGLSIPLWLGVAALANMLSQLNDPGRVNAGNCP